MPSLTTIIWSFIKALSYPTETLITDMDSDLRCTDTKLYKAINELSFMDSQVSEGLGSVLPTNRSCWEEDEGGFDAWYSCAMFQGCPNTGDDFCNYSCHTNSDGCSFCYICTDDYSDGGGADPIEQP